MAPFCASTAAGSALAAAMLSSECDALSGTVRHNLIMQPGCCGKGSCCMRGACAWKAQLLHSLCMWLLSACCRLHAQPHQQLRRRQRNRHVWTPPSLLVPMPAAWACCTYLYLKELQLPLQRLQACVQVLLCCCRAACVRCGVHVHLLLCCLCAAGRQLHCNCRHGCCLNLVVGAVCKVGQLLLETQVLFE